MSEIKPQDIEALLETFDNSSNWNELHLKVDGLELFVSKTPGARAFLSATDLAESRAPIPASTGNSCDASIARGRWRRQR